MGEYDDTLLTEHPDFKDSRFGAAEELGHSDMVWHTASYLARESAVHGGVIVADEEVINAYITSTDRGVPVIALIYDEDDPADVYIFSQFVHQARASLWQSLASPHPMLPPVTVPSTWRNFPQRHTTSTSDQQHVYRRRYRRPSFSSSPTPPQVDSQLREPARPTAVANSDNDNTSDSSSINEDDDSPPSDPDADAGLSPSPRSAP